MSKVYWDAGHGGYDPGAVGYVKESDVNIKVVNYAYEHLEKNYVVEQYKDLSANDSLATICNRANKWKADLFISIHFNAGGGDGFEVYVYSTKNKELGRTIEKHVKEIGQNSRGVKYDPELIVLNSTNMKAALVECAFVDNKKDIKDWDENHELKEMGEAIAEAVADWLNLKKKQFKVKVIVNPLNIRSGPGTNYAIKSKITDKGIYTIVEQDGDWGKLKSGAGWINTSSRYCKKV